MYIWSIFYTLFCPFELLSLSLLSLFLSLPLALSLSLSHTSTPEKHTHTHPFPHALSPFLSIYLSIYLSNYLSSSFTLFHANINVGRSKWVHDFSARTNKDELSVKMPNLYNMKNPVSRKFLTNSTCLKFVIIKKKQRKKSGEKKIKFFKFSMSKNLTSNMKIQR